MSEDSKNSIGYSPLGNRKCSAKAGERSYGRFIAYLLIAILSGVLLGFMGIWIYFAWYLWTILGIIPFIFTLLALWELIGGCTIPEMGRRFRQRNHEIEKEEE